MCDVPIFVPNLRKFELKILHYLKDLYHLGWYVTRLYKGDCATHYLLTRTKVEIDPYTISKCQYEVSFDSKKLKNGEYLYIFNDEFYSTEDEVIDEMKRIGIK